MKSLEIINNDIRHYENACLKAYDYKGEQLSKLYQIKQDLEVLEIIRKKEVKLKDLKLSIQGFIEGAFETIEKVLWSYNFALMEEKHLTLEELLKLKQWLEENE